MFFCSSLQAVLQWWSSSYTVMTVAARQGSTIWGMTTLFDGRHWCFMSMKQILMTFSPLTFWSLNAHTVSGSVWKSKKVGFWSESRKGRPQGDSVGRRQREERDSQQSHTLGGLISNCTCVGLPLNSIGKVFEARANVFTHSRISVGDTNVELLQRALHILWKLNRHCDKNPQKSSRNLWPEPNLVNYLAKEIKKSIFYLEFK